MIHLYIRPLSILDVLKVLGDPTAEEMSQIWEFGHTGSFEDLAVMVKGFQGPSWAICHKLDDRARAVGGYRQIRTGVYQSWFMPTENAFQLYGDDLTEICAQTIENMIAGGAHRLETVVLSNRARARRWYERIGLTFEAEHPGYSVSGQAAATYVRIR